MGERARRSERRPWADLAALLLLVLASLAGIGMLATLWIGAHGDLSAPIDLGGRWGEGSLGAVAAAFAAMLVVFAVAALLAARSLARKWPGRERRR